MKKWYFYIVLTAIIFATMEVAIKLAGSTLNSIQLVFLRFLLGGFILLPFSIADLKKRGIKLSTGDWLYLFFLGTVGISISMPLMQISLIGINANLAAVIISSSPIFTMTFAHFVANDPFTKRKAVSLCLMILGLIVCSNPSKVISGDIDIFYLGCAILGSVTFGFYSAYGKRRIARIGGITQNAMSFLLGSCVLLIMLLAAEIPIVAGISDFNNVAIVLYLGIVVTGLGYYFYLDIIENSSPSKAAVIFFLKPIIAPILAFIVLGEALSVNLVFGVILMLSGSYINLSTGLKEQPESSH